MTYDDICKALTTFKRECASESYGLPFQGMLTIENQLVSALPSVLALTETELTKLRESVDLQLAVLLNRFSRRMANAAVSLKDDALVRCALIAISLDHNLLDERDLFRTGTLILDCCRRRGLEPKLLFTTFLAGATENRQALLLRQISTAPDYMRSLRAMKLGVVQTDDEFKYIDQMFDLPNAFDRELVNKTISDLAKEDK